MYRVTGTTEEIPKLVTADVLSVRCHVSAARLVELAEGGIIPHWRVDDGVPLFHLAEARKWINKNLMRREDGRNLPIHFSIVSDQAFAEARRLPDPLRAVTGLIDISDILANRSGVYFLCYGNEVVYVGQSVRVHARIHDHLTCKEFDRVLFLRWPSSDLDAMEGAMIRLLRPRLNVTTQGILQAPGSPGNDATILGGVCQ